MIEFVAPGRDLTAERAHRLARSRSTAWDDTFVAAALGTGIVCLPSCPARLPELADCRFFPSYAAAVACGLRPCSRCRPEERSPLSGGDLRRGNLLDRAVLQLRNGAVDDAGVAGLAADLAVSERHLRRLFLEHVGATPQQVNRARRALTARTLIESTSLPLGDVAGLAGFGSLRQFNEVMRAEFGRAPSEMNRQRQPAPPAGAGSRGLVSLTLRVPVPRPYAMEAMRRFRRYHAVPGLEALTPDLSQHARVLSAPGGPASFVVVWPEPDADRFAVRCHLSCPGDLGGVYALLRRGLDLDAPASRIDATLAADPLLAPLIAARPGVRVPGILNGAEAALFSVLGQQVSAAQARERKIRLVERFSPVAFPEGDRSSLAHLRLSPDPARIADRGAEGLSADLRIGLPRARALWSLAVALSRGLDLSWGADPDRARRELADIPGIGPWTTEMVCLGAIGDRDSFTADDPVAQRALGVTSAQQAVRRAAAWRPWRGYALMHLWLAGAPSDASASARDRTGSAAAAAARTHGS